MDRKAKKREDKLLRIETKFGNSNNFHNERNPDH